MIIKNTVMAQKSTQNDGTSMYHYICKLSPCEEGRGKGAPNQPPLLFCQSVCKICNLKKIKYDSLGFLKLDKILFCFVHFPSSIT